jgi:hypothetical protein
VEVRLNANPVATDQGLDERIRARAYRLWESEGRPHGRDVEFWERARQLDAIERNPPATLPNPLVSPAKPVIEEAELQENLGEFPGKLTDQGDRAQTPMPKTRARRGRS